MILLKNKTKVSREWWHDVNNRIDYLYEELITLVDGVPSDNTVIRINNTIDGLVGLNIPKVDSYINIKNKINNKNNHKNIFNTFKILYKEFKTEYAEREN